MKTKRSVILFLLVPALLLSLSGCGGQAAQTTGEDGAAMELRSEQAGAWYAQTITYACGELLDLCPYADGYALAAGTGIYTLDGQLCRTEESPADEYAVLLTVRDGSLIRLLETETGLGVGSVEGVLFQQELHSPEGQLYAWDGALWCCDGAALYRDGTALELPQSPDGVWRAAALVQSSEGLCAVLTRYRGEEDAPIDARLIPVRAAVRELSASDGRRLPEAVWDAAPRCAPESGCICAGGRLWQLGAGGLTLLADLQAAGVNPFRLRRVLLAGDGRILCLQEDCLTALSTQAPGPVPAEAEDPQGEQEPPAEKVTLRVGALYSAFELAELIAYVNLHSDVCRLEAKEYDSVDALNRGLLSGEVDLLGLGDLDALRGYAEKGLLCPLEALAPDLFSSGVLYENLVDALRINGACFALPLWLEPAANVIPRRYGLSQGELSEPEAYFTALAENEPELFCSEAREIRFGNWLRCTQDYWIDAGTGEAKFETEAFAALLEYCDCFALTPAEAAANQAAQTLDRAPRSSCIFPVTSKLTEIDDYMFAAPPFGDLSACGLFCPIALAVVDNGAAADAARALLATVFTDEGWHSAWKSDGFRSNCISANREWTEADLDAYADREIGAEHSGIEDAQAFLAGIAEVKELYRDANRLYGSSSELCDVILEEARAYFHGDITAAEAARRIQNRVEIYLAERG